MKTPFSLAAPIAVASCCALVSLASAAPKGATNAKPAPQNTATKQSEAKKQPILLAQLGDPRPPVQSPTSVLNTTITQAEQTQDAQTLLLAYGQAATDSVLARQAISQLLANFYTLRNQAQTPEQASQAINEASLRFQVFQAAQNQILIQQNQQILQQNAQMIQLLQRATGAPVTGTTPR